MEREILFRAKGLRDTWIYGYYLKSKFLDCEIECIVKPNSTEKDIAYLFDTKTLGQFTGLTDKNGVKIFEGDVLKSDNGDVGIVKMMPEYCAFMILIKSENRYCYLWDNYFSYIEVIGNIHDNPELMGGDHNAKMD